jgi:hypothetical protein
MSYAHAPKLPSNNLQSAVDVESGLIIRHDVYNDANDSRLLHPLSVAVKEVLETDRLQVLTDGGYSNTQEVARYERENIEVAAPIKRGMTNSDHFRPAQFVYVEGSGTIRCPADQTLRPQAFTPAMKRSAIKRRPARVDARSAPSARSTAWSIRVRSIAWWPASTPILAS